MIYILKRLPYIRDVYLAFLVDGARKTKTDGYPIIEEWMVAKEPPKDLIQWNVRSSIIPNKSIGMSFYCNDQYFQSVISNPNNYLPILQQFHSVVGMDASPFDNMPPIVQCSQIYVNLAITYYFGRKGIKVIPNVRLASKKTYSSLKAYPKHTLISIGTNGFIHEKSNRSIFLEQVKTIINSLEPTGILIYGSLPKEIKEIIVARNIPIYQYDSFIMKRSSNNEK